jgi:hypothetical protein
VSRGELAIVAGVLVCALGAGLFHPGAGLLVAGAGLTLFGFVELRFPDEPAAPEPAEESEA